MKGISRKRVTVALGLVVALGVGVWVQQRTQGASRATQTMRTAQVVRGTLTASVTASGVLQPYAQVEVRSRSTGTVVDLRVQAGDKVRAGDLLAAIDDKDARASYESAAAQLTNARAKLDQSRQTLAAARAQNATKITQAEAALRTAQAQLAQVLAGSRPEEITQAREALEQAQAAATLARQGIERAQSLYGQGMIARQDLDQAQSQYDTAQAQVRAAQAKLQEAQAGNTAEAIAVTRAQMREAEAALAAARAARLQEAALAADVAASAAQVRSAEGSAAQARDHVGEARIAAPIDGIVATLAVQVGQSVIGGSNSGGTLVMTIADTRTVQAELAVDESDIAHIRIGMPVRVTVDALPGRTFTGRVSRIAPQAVVTQNVTQFTVVVPIDNPDRLLRLGMSVDGEFIIVERQNVLMVPVEAVRGDRTRTALVVEGAELVPVTVETGATNGAQVEIVHGLEAGQTVYLGPARSTTSGAMPRNVNPFMPQAPRQPTRPQAR
jgi:HlyD family secretion protein